MHTCIVQISKHEILCPDNQGYRDQQHTVVDFSRAHKGTGNYWESTFCMLVDISCVYYLI